MSQSSPQSPPSGSDPLPEHESVKLRAENSLPTHHRFRIERRLTSQFYCGRGAVLGASPDLSEVVIVPIRCKSWDCKPCSKRKGYRTGARIASGMPNKFITLTHRTSDNITPREAFALAKAALSRLVKRIRRQFGTFEYAAVWELTKAGNPHVHIAARSAYIPQNWLSHQWRILAGAPIVDIRAVKSPHRVAKYVVKYMLKAPTLTVEAMQGGRLIQISKFYLPDPKDSDPEWQRKAWTWKWLDRPYQDVARDMHIAFDDYLWDLLPSGSIHIKAADGKPLATILTDSTDDSWNMVDAYRREESRQEAEQDPNTAHQLDLLPQNHKLRYD